LVQIRQVWLNAGQSSFAELSFQEQSTVTMAGSFIVALRTKPEEPIGRTWSQNQQR
jgi:hypothetical protein